MENVTTKNSEYLVKSVHYEGKIIYAVISSEDHLNLSENSILEIMVNFP